MLEIVYDKNGIWEIYHLYGEKNSEVLMWESWDEDQEKCSYPLREKIKIKSPIFCAGTIEEFDQMIYREICKKLVEEGLAYKYEDHYYWEEVKC